jgi:hypothetical protein
MMFYILLDFFTEENQIEKRKKNIKFKICSYSPL